MNNVQTVGAIVQARMGSTRLPGKIMYELVDGKCVLEYLLHSLALSSNLDEVIVATTDKREDDELAKWLLDNNINFFRGSQNDCLDRTFRAAVKYNINLIVRITSDCPLVIPSVVDRMVDCFIEANGSVDYLSNRLHSNFPEGLDVEIFPLTLLEDANKMAAKEREREHINYYFLERPDRFNIEIFNHDLGYDLSRFKLSIDTYDDYNYIRGLFAKGLPCDFELKDLAKVITENEK